MTEDEMVGWHNRFNGHEFEQAPGVGDAIQLSHPLSSLSPPAFNLFLESESFPMSQFFASGGQSIGASASASSEYLGLISFRMDWLDLLAVQGTLKCLLQHHSSKALILQHSTFLTVQLSHPYMTTEKTIALITRTCVSNISVF